MHERTRRWSGASGPPPNLPSKASTVAVRAMTRELSVEQTRELMNKAEMVHLAALNLANTLGVFHGINDALEDGEAVGPEVRAINVIQSDLLHLLVIRVCALCDGAQNRADDASIAVLVAAVVDPNIRAGLIAADERWRAGIGPRAERCGSVEQSIGALKGRWTAVTSHPEILKKLYHFRNKRLGHVTVSSGLGQESQLRELWSTARKVLSAARQVRLVFYREDFNYLKSSSRAAVFGGQLVNGLKPRAARHVR
jgi:hypothetical protein